MKPINFRWFFTGQTPKNDVITWKIDNEMIQRRLKCDKFETAIQSIIPCSGVNTVRGHCAHIVVEGVKGFNKSQDFDNGGGTFSSFLTLEPVDGIQSFSKVRSSSDLATKKNKKLKNFMLQYQIDGKSQIFKNDAKEYNIWAKKHQQKIASKKYPKNGNAKMTKLIELVKNISMKTLSEYSSDGFFDKNVARVGRGKNEKQIIKFDQQNVKNPFIKFFRRLPYSGDYNIYTGPPLEKGKTLDMEYDDFTKTIKIVRDIKSAEGESTCIKFRLVLQGPREGKSGRFVAKNATQKYSYVDNLVSLKAKIVLKIETY